MRLVELPERVLRFTVVALCVASVLLGILIGMLLPKRSDYVVTSYKDLGVAGLIRTDKRTGRSWRSYPHGKEWEEIKEPQ